MFRRPLSLPFLLCTLAVLATGCAEQQPPINRVEAYALPKALFSGEWFYQKTVVDSPGTQTVTFEGETAFLATHRVRWNIQEKYLYARMSYEQIQGSKGGNQDSGEFEGEIIGAWAIGSHFDVKRGYNPTTGEENNVLEENTSDCKWYNCKYMRVDWSKNLATDYAFLHFDYNTMSDIKKDPVPFYDQDFSDPKYKPVFDDDAGYIDVTSAMSITPQGYLIPEWGATIPLCWMFNGADASCNAEIIKVRHSFWRRDPNRDFEPRIHRGEKDQWFGYFDTQRWDWLPEHGLLYKAKQHYLLRHNIWAKNHYADQPCKTDADCKENKAGSRCDSEIKFHTEDVAVDTDVDGIPDVYEELEDTKLNPASADSDGDGTPDGKDDANGNGVRDIEDYWQWADAQMVQRCTIPLNKRVPKPVVYFVTGQFPKSLRCDEFNDDVAKDNVPTPCKEYTWTADAAVREKSWSALHHSHQAYEDLFWKLYLRGAAGWSQAEYESWIATHDASKLPKDKQNYLGEFGDKEHGYYSFALCPNNPIREESPWPCRFPRHSFKQAKYLMDQGLKFNHLSYDQAVSLIENGRKEELLAKPWPTPRVGDIRYSYVHYAKDYSAVAPLGYGPNASDVRTGEILSGFANIYSWNDYVATYIKEAIQLINGTISAQDYINGINLDGFIEKVKGKVDHTTQRIVSPAEIKEMHRAMQQPWMTKIAKLGSGADLAKMVDGDGRRLNDAQIRRKLVAEITSTGLYDPAKTKTDLSAIAGTSIEKQLIDREALIASGIQPGSAPQLTEDVLQKASIARGGFIKRMEAREQWRRQISERYNIDFMSDMMDEGLSGIATRLKDLDDENLWARLRAIMTYPVVVHEMGHSFGLMHNFGGSDDAVNYFPEYWQMRTNNFKETKACTPGAMKDDQLCPFFLRPMNAYQLGTDGQSKLSLEEYAFSSVMDYDKWHTMLGLGLGRYDYAALMYGYADKVEVFNESGNLSPELYDQWWDRDGAIMSFPSTGPEGFHYTKWYTSLGNKLFEESNRELVDYRELTKARDPFYGQRSIGWVLQKEGEPLKVRVPYIYCSHNRANISDSCMTGDWGADQYERMKMHIDNWDTWYVMNSFPRSRYYSSPEGYMNKMYSRFYKRLKNFNNAYALYQGLFKQWFTDPQIEKFFTDPINGWGAYTVSINDAFNTLLRTIAMPDVKYYKPLAAEPDGTQIYSEAVFSAQFQTDISNGRYFETDYYDTDYERKCGYYWYECLHHIGFYMDKVMAMDVLSDAATYFVGKDTSEDIRMYRISFFDNFTTQIVDYFGAMLSQDYNAIAPWFDPTKSDPQNYDPEKPVITVDSKGIKWVNGIAQRDYVLPSKDPAKPASGGAVEASTRFTLQLYAGVLGMFNFQDNFDNEFVERGRMWKKGSGSTWDIKPVAGKIEGYAEFTDPFSGTTYTGIDFTDKRGIAQRMIAYANRLKSRIKEHCNPTPGFADSCAATADERATSALMEYRQLMDIMIKLTTLYDSHVRNWSSNPYNP